MVLQTGCQGPNGETSVSAGHCHILGGGPCLACKEDLELEQKNQEIQERRRRVRTQMNANHDPFVLKLPPEVSSHIFLLSMGARDTYVSQRGAGLPTPFLLGAVCRGWRQLARSTPRLWTTLGLKFFDTTNPSLKRTGALPQLIADWLERSGGLPLTLYISCRGNCEPPSEGSLSIINTLNKHSGRWYKVSFTLPRGYLERLCGSSPPNLLRNLTIDRSYEGAEDSGIPLTFKINARPSLKKFSIDGFLLDAVDISWYHLVVLVLRRTTINGVLKVLRNAPLLEKCSLSRIWSPIDDLPIPKTMITLPYLQRLEVSWFKEIKVFYDLIDSLELPSLEVWRIIIVESWVLDNMISLLERSGCSLRSLYIWQDTAPAVEDFERLFQAVPRLRHLEIDSPLYASSAPVVDYVLKCLSASPQYPTLQTDVTTGFLSSLQSLRLCGRELYAWAFIPLIYRWPHRKLLDLYIKMETVTIGREVSSKLAQLVDQGINLRIYFPGGDYIQKLRKSTGT